VAEAKVVLAFEYVSGLDEALIHQLSEDLVQARKGHWRIPGPSFPYILPERVAGGRSGLESKEDPKRKIGEG
jgi:hypothetical protein